MFTHDISVWLPSSSLSKPYIGALKGHAGIVEDAKFLANFPIVVSIDNKNTVRVSSLEKMQCLQVWKVEDSFCPKIHIFRSIPYLALYDKLISYYKIQKEDDFHYFNSKKNHEAKRTNISNTVLHVLYCDYYNCLLVLMEERLKIITINNGKVFN